MGEHGRLLRALHSDNRHERAEAAVRLGQEGATEALDELQVMAGDPDELIAVSAAYACRLLGAERVPLDRVVAGLAADDEETRQAAVLALCDLGEDVVPQLAAAAATGLPHAAEVLRVLGDIGGAEALAAVRRAAQSDDAALAEAAEEVLDDWED